MDSIPQKRCKRCKQEYPATSEYFHRHKHGKYGVIAYCINCQRLKSRERYARHGDTLRKTQREYYARNTEARIAYQIEYNHTHREQGNSYTRKYSKTHPEMRRAACHKRRARIKESGGVHTAADVQLQYQTQKGKCWWCGKKLKGKYEVDHRVPISRGGTNWPDNLVCSCKKCNRDKTNKLPHEWNGRLI